jgi:general secretion pathway protein C
VFLHAHTADVGNQGCRQPLKHGLKTGHPCGLSGFFLNLALLAGYDAFQRVTSLRPMKLALKNPVAQFSLSPRLVQALRMALWLSAVGLAVWVLIKLFAPAPVVAPAMPAQASANYQIDQSPEARLMGVETAGGLTPPSVNLLGVFANSDGKGAAVMSIEGQPAQSRRVGDEVANGWTLEEVGPTFAVMRRSGQRHQVNLPILEADPNLLRRVPANG